MKKVYLIFLSLLSTYCGFSKDAIMGKTNVNQPTFVIHKHHATHLHYDLRLEIDDTYKSWAVPKGPSTDPQEKRLAIAVPDHSLSYGSFEGVIPPFHYGAGPVLIWDNGIIENIKQREGKFVPLSQCYKEGNIEIIFHGKKLQGAYALIKTSPIKKWILVKMKDKFAISPSDITESFPESVVSGKTVEQLLDADQQRKMAAKKRKPKRSKKVDKQIKIGHQLVDITHADKVLFGKSGLTKKDLVEYYQDIAPIMMPYINRRPISMQRFPQGILHEGFFQKDAGEYFPQWITTFPLAKENGQIVDYVVIDKPETLLYLANQNCITIHPWLSKIDAINKPDRLIFDLDPSDARSFDKVQAVAKYVKKLLDALGLASFYMLTGSRGAHLVIPLRRVHTYAQVYDFAYDFAHYLADQFPELITVELRKSKRGKRIFLDWLRNGLGATAVAPYSVRPAEKAPIAIPVTWQELQKKDTYSAKYTIKNYRKKLNKVGDLWQGIQKSAVSLRKAHKQLKKMIQNKTLL
jgi:bifunctional non-homologous end joining protein LigD